MRAHPALADPAMISRRQRMINSRRAIPGQRDFSLFVTVVSEDVTLWVERKIVSVSKSVSE